MSDQQEKKLAHTEFNENELASYLRKHPDFFTRHDYLLAELNLPHTGTGQAVSLIERQVSILREQKLELKHKIHALTDVAKSNEILLEQIQQLIIKLIASPDLDTTLSLLDESLRQDFCANLVAIRLIALTKEHEQQPGFVARHDEELNAFSTLLHKAQPVCGHLKPEQRQFLFADDAHAAASGAIIPLCDPETGEHIGLIGIGSTDAKRFHPEMGTAFLRHLGAVASCIIKTRLETT
ncbi:MAG: DUF484 family protein [Gammaproteobacteria bacterium]|nr:DUF484 family protein [Gammaproteobacteria bacterium]